MHSPLSSPLVKTATIGLEDVQGRPDDRGVALEAAGVCGVRMPLQILQQDGHLQTVAATVSMSVALPPEQKGTHMSRFVIQLSEWSQEKPVGLYLREFLTELATRLHATSASVEIAFPYFLQKKAPVTDGSAPMAHEIVLRGQLLDGAVTLQLQVTTAICTLCPCSKAISDYGAHNQRALLTATLQLQEPPEETAALVWIEEVVALADEAASCPVFPLLKRADEKWVTERQYTNAKFVEDVVRDMTLLLRCQPGVRGFGVRVEALESIHDHNAFAAHQEGQLSVFLPGRP